MHSFKIAVVFCALLVLTGCAVERYRARPISPAQTAASLRSRTLDDGGLREFMRGKSRASSTSWPLPQWSLADLTLTAFYYNPALQIARERVAEAEAAIVTSGARPNPSAKSDFGGETAPESPWIAGFGFSLPLETAEKRRHRITEAERLADVARWALATTAWNVRAQVRSTLLDLIAAQRSLGLLQAEERLRADQVQLLEQRLAAGMIPRPEVDAARIQHTQTLLAVGAAEGRIAQATASLASAIGVPVAALDGARFAWPKFDQPPTTESLTPATIQEDTVLNRLDVHRALAEYNASEAALQLEIAKQYPDFELGPNYAFEEATHLYSVAVGLVLPVFNHNQGPIAEAKARREQMAAQFLAAQANGIGESEQALARYKAVLKELLQARQLLQQALAQEQATQTAFAAGESDRVALNGAQLQTAVTSAAQFDALFRVQQALGELENAVQRPLLPGDLQPLSPQSPVLYPPARK